MFAQIENVDAIVKWSLDEIELPRNAYRGLACLWDALAATRSEIKRWKADERRRDTQRLDLLACKQASAD